MTFDGALFFLFWGSVLLLASSVVLWLFERND
jgi:hypothetical protein